MPWFEFGLNGVRVVVYGNSPHVAAERALKDYETGHGLEIGRDADTWIAIRRLTAKEERRMADREKDSVHDISALEET